MRISKRPAGTTAGHARQAARPVDAFELDNGHGLSVEVWTYGATLVSVRVPDRTGRRDNIVLRHATLAGYEARKGSPYLGSTLGRFSRSVDRGSFSLDGTEHQLDPNDRGHHMHGGTFGFDRLVWDGDAAHDAGSVAVRLRLRSPDGDQGYPGDLSAETVYRLSADGALSFEHRATSSSPTIVDLTNHAYWNLHPGHRIDGHHLALNSGRIIHYSERMVPVPGPPGDVTGTPYDFRRSHHLGPLPVDRFFVLDDPTWAAQLSDPVSGRRMRVVTEAPGLGIYTADRHGQPRGGICLQASALPNAPNRPDFPSVRLDPGQTWTSRTTHHFAVSNEGDQ
ncbi:aldose epimerase family protein [Winogradskya humida]|uniref:Aldose 1-epimerase n=1 Tax=Winogradskya humida TaxID=113566 RepID=A0ABQ4A0Z7_9ACTN|nr:aldose epimerase family protein [Actinoplanes humidus]GIE24540.1 aldose 1-epimerase [Actinoplanes humidus]